MLCLALAKFWGNWEEKKIKRKNKIKEKVKKKKFKVKLFLYLISFITWHKKLVNEAVKLGFLSIFEGNSIFFLSIIYINDLGCC